MKELKRSCEVLLLLAWAGGLWGCATTDTSAPSGPLLGTGLEDTSTATPEPGPIEGTQTGGEGEAIYCGEDPPNWLPVTESVPFPTHYAGRLDLDGGGSVSAELTLSNLGAVYALEVPADAGFHPGCSDGRQGELDWALNADGVLHAGRTDLVVYSAGYRGELDHTFELSEVGLQLEPPTPEDFRAAGMPAPWAPGDGPVRIDVYLHLGDATAGVELRWSCWSCGSSRIALPLASGMLIAGDGVEARVNTPDR
jgi:hypothetical protein